MADLGFSAPSLAVAAFVLTPSVSPRFDGGTEAFGILSAAEVACMRSAVAASLPDTVTILTRSDVSDGMGSVVRSWVEQANVAGRIGPAGGGSVGGEVERAGTYLAVQSWTLTLPHGTTITTADRVLVNGFLHEVVEVTTARSWELCLQARLVRIS